ncbi:MAG TPA: methyltransferase domain-containing protein [Gaiellaceae bacterium]|nr:methyltransferase domain-containing protein [Gaiellaceae bacterium]
MLAAGRDVAEMGAAFGETAAILAETASSVVTVERDPERIEVARERLAEIPDVELLDGDAFELLRGRGPFGLVFVDGGLRPVTEEKWEAILALVEPGGILVKDDMSPGRPVEGDEVREFLLRDPRLAAAEILATPEMAVIVAVRLR